MCSEGDGRPIHSKGLCQACYRRQRRNGQVAPLAPEQRKNPGPPPDPTKPRSRYAEPKSKTPRAPKTHCPHGHSYNDENTFIVNGSKQCKTCRNKRMRDRRPATGVGTGGVNAAKTHCPQGHEYTPENTVRSKDGRRTCRTCARANSSIQVIKKYGITVEQFDALMLAQNGCCAICHDTFTGAPDIDHDHSCCPGARACGQCVRGLLCRDCNNGLGKFHDDVERLLAAAEYLERVQ